MPALVDPRDLEAWNYSRSVAGRLHDLTREALEGAQSGATFTVQWSEGPPEPEPTNPVSESIARAIEASGLSKAEVARRLGVRPPVVSRWLNPRYGGHGVPTLNRMAEALGMRLEVRFVPRDGQEGLETSIEAEPGHPSKRALAPPGHDGGRRASLSAPAG